MRLIVGPAVASGGYPPRQYQSKLLVGEFPNRRRGITDRCYCQLPCFRPVKHLIGGPGNRNQKGNPNKLVERNIMSVGTILLVVLILMLVGAIPAWPHSRSWGYYPSGGLGLVVVILIVLILLGRI